MSPPPWTDLFDFTGRSVVVTGAGNGIGEATARRFAELGASLVLVDRDHDRVTEVAGSLAGSVTVVADITTDAAPDQIVRTAVDAHGGIDVLVNGAGVFPHHPTLDLAWADWDAVVNLNLRATFTVAQACGRVMVDRGGAIVNIASQAAAQPRAGMAAYSSSKGAVVSLTRALALDLAPLVRVNSVAPGPITDTSGAKAARGSVGTDNDDALVAYAEMLPLKRTGRADEVARLIVFLASEAASFITGENVTIDGGRSLA